MTRTQIQIPDVLLGRVRRYAESREASIAEVFRNALELFINTHAVDDVSEPPKRWTVPLCRTTGLHTDPFAQEDWRARIYENHGE